MQIFSRIQVFIIFRSPKGKRNKLEPFRIYIPGHRHIEISKDMTIDEEVALKKSRICHLEEVYEDEPVNPGIAKSMREVPRATEPVREDVVYPDEEIPKDHDIVEFQEPPQMTILHKINPAWAREIIQDGERYGVPQGTTR